jgi:hypothetical protein
MTKPVFNRDFLMSKSPSDSDYLQNSNLYSSRMDDDGDEDDDEEIVYTADGEFKDIDLCNTPNYKEKLRIRNSNDNLMNSSNFVSNYKKSNRFRMKKVSNDSRLFRVYQYFLLVFSFILNVSFEFLEKIS